MQNKDQEITDLRKELEESRERYNLVRHKLQDDSAQLNSLKSIQAASLGEDNKEVNKWLQMRGIKDNDRLASTLQVNNGWELAVDTVLSRQLNAISVQKLDELSSDMDSFDGGQVWLVDQSSAPVETSTNKKSLALLSDKVSSSKAQVDGWFHGVYAMDTVAEALKSRHELSAHESIVTREGCWIGTNWALFGHCLLYTSPSPRD